MFLSTDRGVGPTAALQASPLTAAFMEMVESNDFSRLDKNTAKRHHFLSQFLLRGFGHSP
jgi:hypothetical protein